MRQRRGPIFTWILVLALSACASKPPDPKLEIGRWLNEGERTIGVTSVSLVAVGFFVTRKSTALAGAGTGVSKALYGCCGGDGIIFAPVVAIFGAIIGAVTAEPAFTYHRLADLPGGELLFDSVDFPSALVVPLGLATATYARDRTRHRFDVLEPDQGHDAASGNQSKEPAGAAVNDATIEIYSKRVGFVGVEDASEHSDPSIGLFVDAVAYVLSRANHPDQGTPLPTKFGAWKYEGRRQRLSAWAADDGKLLREEVARAVDELADEIVDGLVALQARAAAPSTGPARRQ